MIALDTNILARHLLNDDAGQFERARSLIESAERKQAITATPGSICQEPF